MYSSPVPPRVIQPRQDMYGSDRDLTFSAHQQEKRNVGKTFQYNGRVAAVILPCLGILVGYGGPVVAGVLIVGCMISYIMDAMRFKEGAFLTVWMTMIMTNMAMGYSTLFLDNDFPLPLALLALVMNTAIMFMTGCWATLQFKWIQAQYPAVVIAFERMLMTTAIPTMGTVLYWGLILHGGMGSAPYFVSGVLCGMYAYFGRPLKSSFQIYPHRSSSGRVTASSSSGMPSQMYLTSIQNPVDGVLSFLITLLLPTVVYVATHHATIITWTHLWSVLLLVCMPLLFVSAIPKGMWWLGDSGTAEALRRILVLSSFAGLLAGVEGRIVFHSFGQYIKLAPPWSYIAITFAVYGLGAVVLLHISGMMGDEAAGALLGPVLMISASVGSLIMGMPIWVLPFPLISAAGVALFYDSRSLRDYLLLIFGSLATAAWFVWQHFWFLDISLDGMNLKVFCSILLMAMVPAVLVPGMIMSKKRGIGTLLVVQAILVAILEEHLYAGDYLDVTFDVHPMFPASLVVGTSLLGVILARRLSEAGTINKTISFALQCIYGSKVVMLTVPEARLAMPVIAYALASLHPLFLRPQGPLTARRPVIQPWQGVAMAACVFLAVAGARFAVFDTLHMLLNRKPSEALAAGTLLLLIAGGIMPMVTVYYEENSRPKRIALLVGSLGLLLILLRPPLPIKGGAECPKLPLALCPRLWDASHSPEHEVDDVAVYGDGLRRREHWPLWMIVVASFFGILAATSRLSQNARFAPIRLIQGSICGILVGVYMAFEFFPGMLYIQVVVGVSALLISSSVVLLSVPSRGSAVLLPFAGLIWLASFPVALVAESLSSLPPLPSDMQRLHPDVVEFHSVVQLRRESLRIMLVSCFAAESLIISFACKLRLSSLQSKSSGSSASLPGVMMDAAYIDKAAEFLGGYVPTSINPIGTGGMLGNKYKKLKDIGLAYLPEACNFITFFCYCLSMWINWSLEGSSSAMTLVISSILLLLCQDSLLCNGLTEKRRYVPPFTAGAAALVFTSMWDLMSDALEEGLGLQLVVDNPLLIADVAFVAFSSPILLEMSDYLWMQQLSGNIYPVILGLLSSVGVMISTTESVRILCGLSSITAIYLITASQHRKYTGNKLI